MKYFTKRMLEQTTGRSNEQTEQENGKHNKVCAKELVVRPRSNLGFVSIFGFPDSVPDSVTPNQFYRKLWVCFNQRWKARVKLQGQK